MKIFKKSLILSLSLVFIISEAHAMETDDAHKRITVKTSTTEPKESPAKIRRAVIRNLVGDNQQYSTQHPNKGPDNQSPRATIVSCSDSRCQTTQFDQTPEEDLFVIRNIGNQFALTKGSIWYGVKHLKTPLLLFIGHAKCGAILAKLDGTEINPDIPQYVKDELKTLYVDDRNKNDLNLGIMKNVHHQVEQAIYEFDKEENGKLITTKELTVLGAIYDFRDDFGRGANSLIFINVNGNTNPVQIEDDFDFKASLNPIIGVGSVEKNKIKNEFFDTEKIEKK